MENVDSFEVRLNEDGQIVLTFYNIVEEGDVYMFSQEDAVSIANAIYRARAGIV